MPAISALVALLKRWKTEVTASYRSSASKKRGNATTTSTTHQNNNTSTTAGRSQKRQKKSPNTNNPNTTAATVETNDNDGEEYVDHDETNTHPVDESSHSNNNKLSHSQLVEWGLRVCRPLAQWIHQPEFASWSGEAKELVWEATTLMVLVSAALSDTTSHSLVASLDRLPWNTSTTTTTLERHETCLAILRGIYPTLVGREELPGGQAGKQAAATAATRILQGLIVASSSSTPTVAQNDNDDYAHITTATSPPTSAEDPTDISAAVTPKSSRKSRRSFGTGPRRKSADFMSPPRLKTPHSSSNNNNTAPPNTTARPNKTNLVVATLSGFLQKLATDKAAEKTSVRASMVQAILACLPELSDPSAFCKFLIQLTHSKVHIHRLVACELVG